MSACAPAVELDEHLDLDQLYAAYAASHLDLAWAEFVLDHVGRAPRRADRRHPRRRRARAVGARVAAPHAGPLIHASPTKENRHAPPVGIRSPDRPCPRPRRLRLRAHDQRRAPGITYAIVGGHAGTEPRSSRAFRGSSGAVNGDPDVELTVHLGDIKDGASLCSDAYFDAMRANFDSFQDPFVLTPGDNEWTDCHRPAAGGYLPTERLARFRWVFYPRAHQSLGLRHKSLETQADEPGFAAFVENRMWKAQKVVFATVHVTGSNNDLVPWFGTAETPAQRAERLAEYEARLAATLAWLDRTFALRRRGGQRAASSSRCRRTCGSTRRSGSRRSSSGSPTAASAFGRPVLLLEGDSHRYTVDRPLAAGSALHGVTTRSPEPHARDRRGRDDRRVAQAAHRPERRRAVHLDAGAGAVGRLT